HPSLFDLFPAGVPDVRRVHSVHRECVQYDQGGAELYGSADHGNDGAAIDDDVHSERSKWSAGAGAVMDPALHSLYDDEPGGGRSAVVGFDWDDGAAAGGDGRRVVDVR